MPHVIFSQVVTRKLFIGIAIGEELQNVLLKIIHVHGLGRLVAVGTLLLIRRNLVREELL
jgi:hypothetical protein